MNWFRRARQADPAWNLAKTLVQMAVFWSFFLFVLPPWLMAIGDHFGIPAFRSDAGRGVAIVLFLSASALGLFSAVTMAVQGHGTPLPLDGPRKMVIAGPYAWVRNPMVVAGLAQGAAVALWHGSLIFGGYVIAGGVV